MNDPYKVLNIPPTATDDEVKHAYRELARKYHPDNYHDNPLADLAQEKMKEINEAYEMVQKMRRVQSAASTAGGRPCSSYTYTDFGGGKTSDYTYTEFDSEPVLQEVRAAINRGDISRAERLLQTETERGAEWNFLMGVVCSRRGWMDEARTYLETACNMEPGNMEYRSALATFEGEGYRPAGFRNFGGTMSYNNDCMRLCTAWTCCMLSGGRCCIC